MAKRFLLVLLSVTSAVLEVSVGDASPQTAFLTAYGQNNPALRADFSGWVGMKLTVGGSPLMVGSVGRICVSGNSLAHLIKFVDAGTGIDVPGGSASVNMAQCQPGQFVYTSLANPIPLPAGTSYYLVSQESAGGDQWYDYGVVTATNTAAVNSSVYSYDGMTWIPSGPANTSYVPPNFQYSVIPPGSPDLTVFKSHSGAFIQGDTGDTYTIVVSNSGGAATNGIVSVSDSLPSGLTAAGINGSGWSCTQPAGPCMRSDPLAAGGTYPSITLTVAVNSNAPANVTNRATVSGGGEGDTSNDTALDLTTIQPASAGTAFLSQSVIGSPIRNNFSGWVGMQLTVAARQLSVLAVGRTCLTGNSGSHMVKFVASNGIDVPGGGAAVNLAGCTPGHFVHSALANPIVLQPGVSYYLVSLESGGGDAWYDHGPVSSTSDASVLGSVYSADGTTWIPVGPSGTSYVPPDFLYAAVTPTMISFTVQANTSGVSFSVDGTTYTSPQVFNWAAGSPHTVTATSPQNGNAGTQYTWNNWSDSGAISHTITPASSGTLTANFNTQYLLSVSVSPAGAGSVVANPPSASGYYNSGTTVQLTATPAPGCTFVNWSGDATGSSVSQTMAVSVPRSVTGNFQCNGPSLQTFLTGFALNSPAARNNFSGWVGMKLTTGVNTLIVSSLGRLCLPGNSGTHIAKFVNANTGADVPGGSASLAMVQCQSGQFVYASLLNPITLQANTSYYLVTQESIGGDQWYDYGAVTATTAAIVTGSIYSSDGSSWITASTTNTSYVPPNFLYVLGSPGPPDLVITVTHSGNFTEGDIGDTYAITVGNSGAGPVIGTVSVTDMVPSGLIATAIAGSGWLCTQPAGPCTRADALAAGGSYPVITLTVNVAENAPPTVINTAVVSGGGEASTGNDIANDPTTIQPPTGPATSITLNGAGGGRIFEGIGAVSAGGSSRLLIDYPEPYRSQILDYLFKPNYGASFQHLKVEIGGDEDSAAGSEPAHMRSATDQNYTRGYEWWLMQQAKMRNPNIKLDVLEWGAPGWLGGGHFYSQDNINYIVNFIIGAKNTYNLTIDYVGIWNETFYNTSWIKSLKSALTSAGLSTKIVAADQTSQSGDNWTIVDAAAKDPALMAAIDVFGQHYVAYGGPGMYSTYAAQASGKPLWDSEDGPWHGDWTGATLLAKLYNHNYLDGKITKTGIWSPVTAYYDLTPFSGSGLMYANTPWSGNFNVQPAVWATAHTTQFVQPGWQYIDSSSGSLSGGGSYVTLKNGSDYSVIVETMDASATQTATFTITSGLASGTVHVWTTNSSTQFTQLTDITPVNGSFRITLAPRSLYSLTTTAGQTKGSATPPPPASFPFPYSETFEGYSAGQTIPYFSDLSGAFESATCGGGRSGTCLRQVVSTPPITYPVMGPVQPATFLGSFTWSDYQVSTDVLLEQSGVAKLIGRLYYQDSFAGSLQAYELYVDDTGNWSLRASDYQTLALGSVPFSLNTWHTLQMVFQGSRIQARIDGALVATVSDTTYPSGMAGVGAQGWTNVQFDNFRLDLLSGISPPSVTQSPSSTQVTTGKTASFRVTVSATAPLSFQWQSQSPGTGGFSNIAGATNSVYTIQTAQLSDNGTQFRCVITNTAGSVTSAAATLTVQPGPPLFSQQPQGAVVALGQTAAFTVGVTGTGPVSYQWQSQTPGALAFSNISGATSASYITPAAQLINSGTAFRCVVTNSSGSTASIAATLTVQPAGTAFVTSQLLGNSRNDYTGWVGIKIQVGGSPLTVTALGRYRLVANSGIHQMKVVDAATGIDVPGSFVSVALTGGAGNVIYAALSSAITLNANAAYYILSQETAGGEGWYDKNTTLQTTNVATVVSAVYGDGTSSYVVLGGASQAYGPVSFLYSAGGSLRPLTQLEPSSTAPGDSKDVMLRSGSAIILDGASGGRVFEGLGAGINQVSSRLLAAYPEAYQGKILDYLFQPNLGAALEHLTIEMGQEEDLGGNYAFWLMLEAKRRNPEIKLELLLQGGSSEDINRIANFISSVQDIYHLTINYLRVGSEISGSGDGIKSLKNVLLARGLATQIVARTSCCAPAASVVDMMWADSALMLAIDRLDISHGPSYSAVAAQLTGKAFSKAEDISGRGEWSDAMALADKYNRNYIIDKAAQTEVWNLASSFDGAWPNSVPFAIWASAHTTQFARPGWQYADNSSGFLAGGGSYVTLMNGVDYTSVIETLGADTNQKVRFTLAGGLSHGIVHVWKSDAARTFQRQGDILPADGSFTLVFEPDAIYTLTTTAGPESPSIPRN